MTNTENVVTVRVNAYRAKVTEAVTFARNDPDYQQYVRQFGPRSMAATITLADKFGTWVGHDARKAMGHV